MTCAEAPAEPAVTAPAAATTAGKSAPGDSPRPDAPLPELPLKSEAFNAVLDSYDDQDSAQEIEFESFEEILTALQACTPEHLLAHVDPKATYTEMMLRPENCRGHVAQVRSVLRLVYTNRLIVAENRSGISEVTQGQVANIRGEIITFISIDPLPPELKAGDGVQFTGIFLKRYAYLNDKKPGNSLTWSPLIFAKHLDSYFEPPAPAENPMQHPLAILSFLVIGAGLGVYFYLRTKARTSGANYFSRLKRQRKAERGLKP